MAMDTNKTRIKTSGSHSAKRIELFFLGTGAADWPSKYPPSENQLERGEVRGMSSMLVNKYILIDCGPTVLDVMNRYKVNPLRITDILLTHTHTDHFHHDTLLAIAEARNTRLRPLRFWAHPEALKQVPNSDRIEKLPIEIGTTFRIRGFSITGIESNP